MKRLFSINPLYTSAIALTLLFSGCAKDKNGERLIFSVEDDIALGNQVAAQTDSTYRAKGQLLELNDPRPNVQAAYTQLRGIVGKILTSDKISFKNEFGYEVKIIKDEKILDRIKKLVIPPAWTDVWICPSPNGHIQVTGRDAKGRKQYIYHPDWNNSRSETKFSRMLAFGKMLPDIRKKLEADLRAHKLNRQKITAIAVNLMDQSLIRIGNKSYAKSNKSYGLTTLRDKHVKISGAELKFEFVGKKGVAHSITIQDKKLP